MDRVYVILDITDGKHGEAVESLQANPGVQWMDLLEGQWDVIMAIEASSRLHLAKHLVRALASVEAITENLQLLPTYNGHKVQSTDERVRKATINKAGGSKRARKAHW